METLNRIFINNWFVAIIVLLTTVSSCKKQDDNVVPGNYEKRVLIEEISAEWCPSCPQGAKIFKDVISNHPGEVFGVSIHRGDPLELEYPNMYELLDEQFGVSYFPYAFFDRTSNQSMSWSQQTGIRLKNKSNVGVKLKTSIKNDKLDIKVEVISDKKLDNVHLTVYLVEDNVAQSSPGAQRGADINYKHPHVLRKVITSDKVGDYILLEAGNVVVKDYDNIKINKYKKENLEVIAFVHYNVTESYEVLNCNGVKAGESVDW